MESTEQVQNEHSKHRQDTARTEKAEQVQNPGRFSRVYVFRPSQSRLPLGRVSSLRSHRPSRRKVGDGTVVLFPFAEEVQDYYGTVA